ncbi:hypothetical protein KTH_30740 [Thermosporothrix hazakensis]|nr:hypothetical protein KTH_30740 [Thermosporothrix hazakensis]
MNEFNKRELLFIVLCWWIKHKKRKISPAKWLQYWLKMRMQHILEVLLNFTMLNRFPYAGNCVP